MDCSLPGSSVPGDSPGKDTGVDRHALLQGIFPTQGSNPGLLHCRCWSVLEEGNHKLQNCWRREKILKMQNKIKEKQANTSTDMCACARAHTHTHTHTQITTKVKQNQNCQNSSIQNMHTSLNVFKISSN